MFVLLVNVRKKNAAVLKDRRHQAKENDDDLFEMVRRTVGCTYISDLRIYPYRKKAIGVMTKIDLSGYSQKVLEDMAEYLSFKRPFFYSTSSDGDWYGSKWEGDDL